MEIIPHYNHVQQMAEHAHSEKLISDLNRTSGPDSENKKLKEKCLEFESVLFNSMLKSMRKSISKTGLISGGRAEEMFTSMLDQEYALLISKSSGSGIAEALYEQMSTKSEPVQQDRKLNIFEP
jgi:peptidoglycan hydrolase FlgJ